MHIQAQQRTAAMFAIRRLASTAPSAAQRARTFASTAPAWKTMLVAVDHTGGADHAFNAAMEMAKPMDKIVLFTCGPSVQREVMQFCAGLDRVEKEEQEIFIEKLRQKSDAQAQEVKKHFEEKCAEAGCEHQWYYGDSEEGPRHGIVRCCDEVEADVAVLGSHGSYGTVHRLLLGSTADYVAHHVNCDVLLVKHPHHVTTRVQGKGE